MQQTITIIGPNMKAYDIQVDNKQHIRTTLRVLSENIEDLEGIQRGVFVRVKKSGRMLDLQKTYEEEGIYTGEELTLVPRQQEA